MTPPPFTTRELRLLINALKHMQASQKKLHRALGPAVDFQAAQANELVESLLLKLEEQVKAPHAKI